MGTCESFQGTLAPWHYAAGPGSMSVLVYQRGQPPKLESPSVSKSHPQSLAVHRKDGGTLLRSALHCGRGSLLDSRPASGCPSSIDRVGHSRHQQRQSRGRETVPSHPTNNLFLAIPYISHVDYLPPGSPVSIQEKGGNPSFVIRQFPLSICIYFL